MQFELIRFRKKYRLYIDVGNLEVDTFATYAWKVVPRYAFSIVTTVNYTLKRHCIEFKYYADGIHSGLTSPVKLTIADPPG